MGTYDRNRVYARWLNDDAIFGGRNMGHYIYNFGFIQIRGRQTKK